MAPSKRSAPSRKATKKRKLEEKLPVDDAAVKELRDEMLDGIDDSWHSILSRELVNENGEQVLSRLSKSLIQHKDIFPPPKFILNAFKLTPMSKVKVVILGQDPYHNTGQAMGLAFSVPEGVQKMPPSLPRILREAGIPKDLASKCGDLTTWAQQGVLLLNPVLTVEKGQPGSHGSWGWQKITAEALSQLSKQTTNRRLIFLLWGGKAAAAEALIDQTQHLVLRASHPSPLATKGDFIGCGHFQKANDCLVEQGLRPIQWDSPVLQDWQMEEEEAMTDEIPAAHNQQSTGEWASQEVSASSSTIEDHASRFGNSTDASTSEPFPIAGESLVTIITTDGGGEKSNGAQMLRVVANEGLDIGGTIRQSWKPSDSSTTPTGESIHEDIASDLIEPMTDDDV